MKKYLYRGLSMTLSRGYSDIPVVYPVWAVLGIHETAAGVLEWCYDEEDAWNIVLDMSQDPSFFSLCIGFAPSEEERVNHEKLCFGCVLVHTFDDEGVK